MRNMCLLTAVVNAGKSIVLLRRQAVLQEIGVLQGSHSDRHLELIDYLFVWSGN